MAHVTLKELTADYYRLLDVLDVGSRDASSTLFWLRAIRADAMRLSNLGERECNGVMKADGFMGWDDADQRKADNTRRNAEKRIRDALDQLFDRETFNRLVIEFQGDPRGPSVIVGTAERSRVLVAW